MIRWELVLSLRWMGDYLEECIKDYAEYKEQIKPAENLLEKGFSLNEALETAKLDREIYMKFAWDQ